VTVETIRIPSGDGELEALLFVPPRGPPHPFIVMAGGWCYVKELVQPLFAEVFVQAGFGVLIFDYRTFGGSTGEPRRHIDPWMQIEDYRNALSYLETRPDVDSDRLAAWGISYSGGHVLILGALDDRVQAVCSVVPVIDGWDNLRLGHGTVSLRALFAALRAARKRLYETGEQTYIDHQPVQIGAVGTFPFPHSRETFKRLTKSEGPAYEGSATAQSTDMLLAYSVRPFLSRLVATPTLMCLAEGDDHTHWDIAAQAFDSIPGTRKQLHVVHRAGHLTLYEDVDVRRSVAGIAAAFFAANL
jgi:uncharacterized protein